MKMAGKIFAVRASAHPSRIAIVPTTVRRLSSPINTTVDPRASRLRAD